MNIPPSKIEALIQLAWDAEFIHIASSGDGRHYVSIYPSDKDFAKRIKLLGFDEPNKAIRKALVWQELWRNIPEQD